MKNYNKCITVWLMEPDYLILEKAARRLQIPIGAYVRSTLVQHLKHEEM